MPWWKICSALLLTTLISATGWGAAEEEEDPKLLGRTTVEQLREEPFAEWFDEGHDGYEPNPDVLAELQRLDKTGVAIQVFFGTWCGDSRREVPRLVKLLRELELPTTSLEMVAVEDLDEGHKQSPEGEQQDKEIYRLPTIVVSRDGRELARLVEVPVLSLERDLLQILSGNPYQSSFASYPVVRRWLREGLLADENVSNRGLASQVRHLVNGEGDLAAAGRVLLARHETQEAVKLFGVNCALYSQSSRCFARLADGLQQLGDLEEARKMAEKALRLNDDPERVEDLVAIIDKTKKKAEQQQGTVPGH